MCVYWGWGGVERFCSTIPPKLWAIMLGKATRSQSLFLGEKRPKLCPIKRSDFFKLCKLCTASHSRKNRGSVSSHILLACTIRFRLARQACTCKTCPSQPPLPTPSPRSLLSITILVKNKLICLEHSVFSDVSVQNT